MKIKNGILQMTGKELMEYLETPIGDWAWDMIQILKGIDEQLEKEVKQRYTYKKQILIGYEIASHWILYYAKRMKKLVYELEDINNVYGNSNVKKIKQRKKVRKWQIC